MVIKRILTLLDTIGEGQSVTLTPGEIIELVPLGLKARRLGMGGNYSRFVSLTPENKAVLEKAGYSFRVPVR